MLDLQVLQRLPQEEFRGIKWSRLQGSYSLSLRFREGHVVISLKGITFFGVSDDMKRFIEGSYNELLSEVCR